ncbi:ATP-dependent helicase, partial [Bradyrhizobium sp.]|uniref:ATP-dependent helicase n=1 Tax=Bradyrhizobium sp. TaxID=376 RepID=UPI002914CA0E
MQAVAATYLDELNPEQRRAVEHGGTCAAPGPPLLIIAGAGSGKTNTLAHRVAHLLVNGADPRRILLMTFSRRAAAEMSRRVERIARKVLGGQAEAITAGLTWAGTFHGLGARMLRDYAERIGIDAVFTIHDREDSADLMNLVRHERGLSNTQRRFPTKGTCLAIYSRCVNADMTLDEALVRHFPWCTEWAAELKGLFAAYVEAKQANAVLDYDDLLLYWAQMMADETIAREIGERFDHVLVDEYQDTNRLQSQILLGLKPDGVGLTVVGDDAQSIYAFRAATVRNILEFPDQFSPRADIVTLDRNYRSTQPILSAANAVIGLARERFTKNLWTDRTASRKPPRRRRDDDYDDYEEDEYDDDEYEEEEERMPRKVKATPPRKKRRWLGLIIKLILVLAVLLAIYGVYLDSQIRSRIDGKVWQLPAAVYGRMVNLEPGMPYSKKEMVNLLEGMQYRQVSRMTRPGEFTVQANSIEMLRRPFDFPDGKEGQIRARLDFQNNRLAKIENLDSGRSFGFFRLDPRLITMLQSPNGEQRL